MISDDLLLLLPLYLANAALLPAMRLGLLGTLHKCDRPVSAALFGKERTCLGAALILAITTAGYFFLLGKACFFPGLGMIIGVHASSFLKRRLGMGQGSAFPLLDQLDFFAGGVAGLALCGIFLSDLPLAAVITFFVHLFSNMIAYKTGLKDVWW